MRPTLGLALLMLVAASVAPFAAAEYGSSSAVTIDAPGQLGGRVDALLPRGFVSFVSSDATPRVEASLRAVAMEVVSERTTFCGPEPSFATAGCAAVPSRESVTLLNAEVSVVRATGGYKILVTNKEEYADTERFGKAGVLAASTGATTLLGANAQALYLSPYESDWSSRPSGFSESGPYTVEAWSTALGSTGGSVRAVGGFETFLQGLEVKVKGTKTDGSPFEKTYRTGTSRAGGNTVIESLTIESDRGLLHATSGATLAAYEAVVLDVRGSLNGSNGKGTIEKDGKKTAYDNQDVFLEGPLSLTITRVTPGDPARLAMTVSSRLRVFDAANADDDGPTDATMLAAAGVAGASGAALLAAIMYFWPRLKFGAVALAVPLYTRISRAEVLEHDKRDEIYELIRTSPGIHAHEIGAKTQIGWGTTVYHLKLLEEHSLVVSKKSGRYKRFFVNTGEFTKKKDAYGALRNDTARAVADYIVHHPGCNQKDLCGALGIQPSLASWHVQKLEQVDLVKRVKDGRMVRYYAGPAWTELNMSPAPRAGADGVAET